MEKVPKIKCSEWGLPGVEMIKGACGSIFNVVRPPQTPYNGKIKLYDNLYIFLYISPISPLKGIPITPDQPPMVAAMLK